MVEKYYNNKGEVGVLYSPGFGGGWSTWADDALKEFMIFDKGLVELKLQDEQDSEKVEEYIRSKLGDVYVYISWNKVRAEFLPRGARFLINEYDGSESIEYLGPSNCFVA